MTTMAQRPLIGISKAARTASSRPRTDRAEILRARTMTRAITPMAPIRLSRIMTSIRSRLRALKRPSALSARPSRCRAPEKEKRIKVSKTAATGGGIIRHKTQAQAPAIRPRTSPTTGKKSDEPARSSPVVPKEPGSGRMVRKRKAAAQRLSHFMPLPATR